MAAGIYLLCALTSLTCCVLLFRSWRRNRAGLLFWSWLCFAGLSFNNIVLVVDKLLLPQVDLGPLRMVSALVSLMLLLFGLVWEDQ